MNIYKTIKSQGLQAFVDIEGYPNPSIITGDEQRPDFAIVKSDNLLLLELTVGFETNIKKNFNHKAKRYQQLFTCWAMKQVQSLLCKFKFGCYWHNRER